MVIDDHYFMRMALKEAFKAQLEDEVPVGAVVVQDGAISPQGRYRTPGPCS